MIDKKVENYSALQDTKFSDELYLQIIKTYLDTESVKDTAIILKTSAVKVRKVLITEELWSSKTSLEIRHYLNLGKTTAEIARILCTSEKAVQQYLPYTKGIYKGDHPSVGALNTADYRERIKMVQEKTLRKNLNLVMKNKWYEMYDPLVHKYSFSLDPVRLHMELVLQNEEFFIGLNNEEKFREFRDKSYREIVDTLRQYGRVQYGDTISRDVVVPGEMPLWALHYIIQKCFGWQNSHLHCFELPEDQFKKICDGESKKFVDLMGVVFRSIWMDEQEEFWNDDYENGSFKTWLRSKYTGPYESLCHGEGIWQCKQDIKEMKKRYQYVKVDHTVGQNGYIHYSWPHAITKEEYEFLKEKCPMEQKAKDGFHKDEIKITEVFTFDEIPFEAMRWMSETGMNKVLERLSILDVMTIHNKGIDDPDFCGEKVPACFADVMNEDVIAEVEDYMKVDFPDAQPTLDGLTDELIYSYDYGDGWKVRITASYGAADLLQAGRATQEELDEAIIKMHETWRPVCIAQDGINVLDDVGGIYGYIQFLRGINQKGKKYDPCTEWSEEFGNYADKEESLQWAKSLGWSKRRSSNKNLL